jgi:hypothetical protein
MRVDIIIFDNLPFTSLYMGFWSTTRQAERKGVGGFRNIREANYKANTLYDMNITVK